MDKYQEALVDIRCDTYNFIENNYDDAFKMVYNKQFKLLQELIDKHKKIKEDLLFLKEQGVEILESPNGRKFLALEITNMPSEINYRKELFEKLMNDIINNIINGE